jgi:hypothetical protein
MQLLHPLDYISARDLPFGEPRPNSTRLSVYSDQTRAMQSKPLSDVAADLDAMRRLIHEPGTAGFVDRSFNRLISRSVPMFHRLWVE